MAQNRQTATIYQVATQAGVSIATVSRALNGSDTVAESTRKRVLIAAKELKFRPSRLGQSLAEGRHAANGIVFPDLSGPYYAEVILGYEEVAAELGSSVLILATHGRPDPPGKVMDLARRVDGMVLIGRTVPDSVVTQVTETGIPVVLLARPAVGSCDTLNADNVDSAHDLVRHLVGHGYERFGFLGDPGKSPDVHARYEAFRAALRAAGRRVRRCAATSTWNPGGGRRPGHCAVRHGQRCWCAATTRRRWAPCRRPRTWICPSRKTS